MQCKHIAVCMESSQEDGGGGQLYRTLGDLKFLPFFRVGGGGTWPNVVFKIFHTFLGGGRQSEKFIKF